MMSLVNKTLTFQMYYTQNHLHFLLKKCEELLQCKNALQFFSKNIAAVDFVSTENDLTNPPLTTSLSLRCFEQLGPDVLYIYPVVQLSTCTTSLGLVLDNSA